MSPVREVDPVAVAAVKPFICGDVPAMSIRSTNVVPAWRELLVLPALALVTAGVWAARPEIRTDAYGDPLPDTALVRLGTSRLELGRIDWLRFSPDGKILVSAGRKAAVRCWEVATGKELRILGVAEDVEDLAFAPNGKLLAVATGSRIHYFDPASGAKLPREAGPPFCSRLAFSPNSKVLAASDGERDLFLIDAATGRQIPRWEAHDQRTAFLAFTPDGKGLISAGLSREGKGREDRPRFTYRLWDAASGQKRAEARLPDHLDVPSPWGFLNGKDWTVLCYDLLAERQVFWQPATGKELPASDGTADRWLATSPDGKIAARLGKGAVDFWDVFTGKRLESLQNSPWNSVVALSPDGASVAFLASDSIHVWDRQTRSERLAIAADDRPFVAMVVAPDGRTVATGSEDGSVRLWNRATGEPLRRFVEKGSPEASGKITHLTFTPDGKQLLAARQGGAIQVWNAADGRLARTIKSGNALRTLSVAANGTSLILTGQKDMRQLELATGKEIGSVSVDFKTAAWAIPPDGRLVARPERGRLLLHDLDNPKNVRETGLEPAQASVGAQVAFSPEGLLIVVAGRGKIWFVDAVTGLEVAQNVHALPDSPRGLAFSPDGQWLQLADERRHHLLSLVTGREVWSSAEAKRPIAFTPDGKAVVAGEEACTALVWDVAGLVPAEEALAAQPQAILQALTTALGSNDGLQAYRAFRWLRTDPAVALPLIRGEFGSAAKAQDERIARLIRDLDADKFLVRQRASEELGKLGTRAAAALFRTLEEHPPLEVRQRVDKLLLRLNAPAAERRVRWAVKLVELAGTREAYQLLQELADGAADAPTTKEASAALERVPKPPR
jgi:WD40 repeat protein